MSDNNGFSEPGASVYDSKTMTVGDGTWDANRNSFLLPNLMGLNFETMRYNGMGNRFQGLPQYHRLIMGHAIVAAITFLGLVPLSIFLSKWGKRYPGPRRSFKLHVYIQILVIFLVTVVFALGWLAVGPERSLSNPHHGIGLTIYVLYIIVFLQAWLMYRHERKRDHFPNKLPLGVWIHNLLGRIAGILPIIQIALGLTLYGSPKVLFILYALWVAALLLLYLVLSYRTLPRHGEESRSALGQSEIYSDYGSYLSGSRTDTAPPARRKEKKESHFARNALGAVGLMGAYKWYQGRNKRRDGREGESDVSYTERYDDRPPPGGPPPATRPPSGPPVPYGGPPPAPYPPTGAQYAAPPPAPVYGPPPQAAPYGAPPPSGPMSAMRSRPHSQGARPRPASRSRISAESWEDEKYSNSPNDNTWRNRILGGVGAYAAFAGAKKLFSRNKARDDSYVEDDRDRRYGPGLDGQNRVSRADVSQVEAGEAPLSPDTPRVNMGGMQPMTPSMTPSRPPRRRRPSLESMSYDSRASYDAPRPMGNDGDYTLRESVRTMGPMAGFRDWNRRRKDQREGQRLDRARRQELENEEQYNRRNSHHYPRPQDSNVRHEESGTLLSGPMTADPGSNVGPPDTNQPPLPANAGTYVPPPAMVESRHDVTTNEGYSLPPPPSGPPPSVRADGYGPSQPNFSTAQMPQGAVEPDPARLVAENTAANESSAYGRDFANEPPSGAVTSAGLGAAAAATAAGTAAGRRNDDVTSPTRSSRQGSRTRFARPEVQGSTASGSMSQLNSGSAYPPAPATVGGNTTTTGTTSTGEPQAKVSVKMHQDGKHATLRRLPEEEAAAERAARRQERRARRRRGSSFSSGGENDDGRYRRTGAFRPSQGQPIANVPPPPASSASWRKNSELNLPPTAAGAPPPVPQHSVSPGSKQTLSPGVNESGVGSPAAYGTDATGTDVSAFDSNRRRRRAERAREAARRPGGRVEFE